MRGKSILLVGGWAMATVGLMWVVTPTYLNATDSETPGLRQPLQEPKLVANGCELTLRWVQPARGEMIAKDTPLVVQLMASNPGMETVRCAFKVSLMSTREFNPMSRVPPRPEEAWSTEDEVSLAPGEQRKVTLATKTPVPAGSTGQFVLASGGQQVTALPYRVETDKSAGVASLGRSSEANRLLMIQAVNAEAPIPAATKKDAAAAR